MADVKTCIHCKTKIVGKKMNPPHVDPDDRTWCRSCADRYLFLCSTTHSRDPADFCDKCATAGVFFDRDEDRWYLLPNETWAMTPLHESFDEDSGWIEVQTLERIRELWGPITLLQYIIHEEEELIFT